MEFDCLSQNELISRLLEYQKSAVLFFQILFLFAQTLSSSDYIKVKLIYFPLNNKDPLKIDTSFDQIGQKIPQFLFK